MTIHDAKSASPFIAGLLDMLDQVTEPDIAELTAEVEAVKAQLEPISERITTVLQNYENHLFWVLRAVNEKYPDLDSDADDGLHAFIRHAIGHRRLWDLCSDVSEMLDPDGLVRPALQSQMDYDRMKQSPELTAMIQPLLGDATGD